LKTHILPGDGALVAFIRPIVGYLAAKSGSDIDTQEDLRRVVHLASEFGRGR